jgi:hypothetical protein
MPCYHPMPAVRMVDGSVKFVSRNKKGVDGSLELPCGQCIGCRLERSRQWAMRCLHESSLYDRNSFITLTYDEDHLPPGGSLNYPDFQRFMKRLRKNSKSNIRFYMGGEYGETTLRPHFHACLFGYDFPDKVYFRKSSSGEKLYTSDFLQKLWPFGISSIGDVTFQSAAYIARYCVQKVTGDAADLHYSCPEFVDEDGVIRNTMVPEFNHMSLKPGIGARWLKKFRTDVYPRDYVVINGVKTKPPKYYDVLFERENPGVFSDLVAQRELDGYSNFLSGENSQSRLNVKEQVQAAQLSQLKRNLS